MGEKIKGADVAAHKLILSRREFGLMSSVFAVSLLTGCSPKGESSKDEQAESQTYNAGTYKASSQGRNGMVTLDATFSDTKITDIQVTDSAETEVIGDAANNIIPRRILEGQTLNVDVVSGATYTSFAIINAMKDATKQAGGTPSALSKKFAVDEIAEDSETDIVIIGSGGAGMMAAITAHSSGKKVILVEKQGFLGAGDTVLISTGVCGGGSQTLTASGIDQYTAEEFYEQLEAQAVKKNIPANRANMHSYAEVSGELIDYFIKIGVPFSKYDKKRLMYLTDDGSAPGPHIAHALAKQLDDKKIDYRLNTKALSLETENDQVTGVIVENSAGSYTIKAKSVILATGGFSNNNDLLEEFTPEWVGRPTTGAISLTGDGHIMAREIGVGLECMDQIKANYLCHVLPTGDGASLTAIAPYCAIVNHEGKRFMDESDPSITHKSELMMSQTNQEGYAIFDQTVIEDLKLMKGYNEVGYFESGNTFEDLSKKIEVNASAFISTMSSYQQNAAAGSDPDFGRVINDTIENPAYYGALVTPSMQSTYGGVVVDNAGRAVASSSNEIVAGLYAAGASSGHECYANEVGYASIIAFTYGKIAAEAAALDI